MSEVVRDPRMRADVQKAVDYANQAASRAESIRAFTLIEGEFTEENGLLTPSLKVKRQAAQQRFAGEITALPLTGAPRTGVSGHGPLEPAETGRGAGQTGASGAVAPRAG